MNARLGAAALFSVLAVLCGCSEAVSVRSGPLGAAVYLDGKRVGTTPMVYDLPRSQLDEPHEVRLEKAGYEPVSEVLTTRLAKGRVTGAVFTLGILCLFRSMYAVDPVFAELVPVPQAEGSVEDSLRNLERLYDTGRIPEEEFLRRREQMLQRR